MDKRTVTVLYDADEDVEKAKAEKDGKPFPLAYAQVADALTRRGHQVQTVAVQKKIRTLVNLIEKDSSDIIFNLCEAIAASTIHEHNVVGLLELFGKCFTGSGSAGWLLAGDKALCKKVFQFHNIRYPRFCTVEKGKCEWADDLAFPLIVKPLNEDASIGIDKGSVVRNVKELLERISYLHEMFNGATLVEEFIEGREIYVGVFGNEAPVALPVLEWDFSKVTDGPKIAGSEAKWDPDSEGFKSPEVFVEDVPPDVLQAIQQSAITAYQALKIQGYARIDMRLREKKTGRRKSDVEKAANADAKSADKTGEKSPDKKEAAGADGPPGQGVTYEHFIIEANPNCWLEKRSEFAMAARKHGISYPELLERILELGLQRHRTGG